MTESNNIVPPKRGLGRPKKYFIEEERKRANNGYTKKCMERNPFHCDISDHTYHMASKSKHLRTKKGKKSKKQSVRFGLKNF